MDDFFQNEEMTNIEFCGDEEIKNTVEEIWGEYDKENKGYLTKEQTRKLFEEFFFGLSESGEKITDETFDKIFDDADKNKSGTIEKDELYIVMRIYLNKK